MKYILILSIVVAFLTTFFLIPWVIKYLKRLGLFVKDMNKEGHPLVPVSGGFAVFFGIITALMLVVFIQTFYYRSTNYVIPYFTIALALFILTFVGFVDDLLIKVNSEKSYGLKQWQKPLLTISAAVPLMVVNSGVSIVAIPFIGEVNLGLLFPLLVIPIGVVFAANMVNLLAGFNGLEAGMGIVYTTMLGIYAYVNGADAASLTALITAASLVAFMFFNFPYARILPGDSLTYLLGGVIAVVAVMGNIEKAALIVSIPFIAEFFLKMRSKFKAESFGAYSNGKIKSLYGRRIYSLTHIFTRTERFTEKQIVIFMILIEFAFSLLIWVV